MASRACVLAHASRNGGLSRCERQRYRRGFRRACIDMRCRDLCRSFSRATGRGRPCSRRTTVRPKRFLSVPIPVRILSRANPITVAVVGAAAVVVAVSSSCGGSYCCRSQAIGCASIGTAIGCIAVNAPGDRSSGDWAVSIAATRHSISAATMNSAAADVSAAHAASVISATATAGIGFIWNQADGDQDESCQRSENISKHGVPP